MTEEPLFSKIPSTFVYCTNDDCVRKESCLRHLAFAYAPANQRVISILNKAALCDEGECHEYLSNQPVIVAYGWGKLYDGIDFNMAKTIKKELQNHFGRLNYYRYGRKEKPLWPEDQKYVKNLFVSHGIEKEPEYEYFEKQFAWR